MDLKIVSPIEIIVNETEVSIINARGLEGAFGIEPKHIDYISALTPSILVYKNSEGVDKYVAINEGVLVKCNNEVTISTLNAVTGNNIEELKEKLIEFKNKNEQEKALNEALSKLQRIITSDLMEGLKGIGK